MDSAANSSAFLPPDIPHVKKKPGRKPNPTTPAIRKAQNRAAQRAFRERKMKHMKELEIDTKRLLQEQDKYLERNQQLSRENDSLKWENWYLKGVVLSLQLVCFKSKLHIPKHTPHVEDQELQALALSTPPAVVASYVEMTRRCSSPNNNDTSNSSNHNRSDRPNVSVHLQGASLHYDRNEPPRFHGHSSGNHAAYNHTFTANDDTDDARPIMLVPGVMDNNLAAIQALRLRLRLESAIIREKSSSHTITPTALQIAVPHDQRIDLIPTPHMRDRMIIFRDLFDLDGCLHLLASEAVFHGGDPSVAANWEVPTRFFEKYWFLTTDYTQQRTCPPWKTDPIDALLATCDPHLYSVMDHHAQKDTHDHLQDNPPMYPWNGPYPFSSEEHPLVSDEHPMAHLDPPR
ncbi:hypothetical protein [Absidia glauca]|uniref:BZIP domain-containing protein n=1 Tax=Absidia glauca TaxID=4829 RepID=A0A163MHH5_ABSGL|nr:hypothetical protein [Absidia glauca]